jgi:hypothetical protein
MPGFTAIAFRMGITILIHGLRMPRTGGSKWARGNLRKVENQTDWLAGRFAFTAG